LHEGKIFSILYLLKTLFCVKTLSLSLSTHFSFLQETIIRKPWTLVLWKKKGEFIFSPFSGCWLALGEIISSSFSPWIHFLFPKINLELSWKSLILSAFDSIFGWLLGWVDASIVWLLWDWRKVPYLNPKLTHFFFLLQRVIILGLIGKGSFILFYAWVAENWFQGCWKMNHVVKKKEVWTFEVLSFKI